MAFFDSEGLVYQNYTPPPEDLVNKSYYESAAESAGAHDKEAL